ncbi:efflux RND transporter periplasmic adaptor subunit [Desulfonatronovibrio magnus]|uniref:efflux RND transporter periplasmic adaptor subunit n=1 Tax=Desulfonatronovibrio magnus TaxID=698827 RepID=UPI000698D223|nr:efflux RND transporter periplasmic adaptor subunit [Desulfonatronovibrio magnus]
MSTETQYRSDERSTTRKVMLKLFGPWTFFIIILSVAGYFFMQTMGQEEEEVQAPQRPPAAVETANVIEVTLSETVRGIGTLRPAQRVEIKPETGGRIGSIHFQEGSFVEQDQILFSIEEQRQVQRLTSNEAALEEAKARKENLRRNYERFASLFEENLIAEDKFDSVKTDLESVTAEVRRLSAQVALAREDLSDTVIRSPFSGYISRRLVDTGAYVSSGQVLASMYQTCPLEISVMIPELYIPRVAAGQKIHVQVSAHPDQKFSGHVTFISPTVDESTRSFEIKASIPNLENMLRPGSFASAQLILGYRHDTRIIPERSLVATREGYLVFVVVNDQEVVESRNIEIGMRRPGLVEIVKGLEVGEEVVVAGHMNLNDGAAVNIVKQLGSDWAELDEPTAPGSSGSDHIVTDQAVDGG